MSYSNEEIRNMGFAGDGDKVRFLGRNGYDGELQRAKDIFWTDKTYTVAGVSVGGWSSTYTFEEVGGSWNTVMFERIDDETDA